MDYRELHQDALVIDCHNDAIVAHIRGGGRSFEPDDAPPVEARAPGAEDLLPGTIAFLRGATVGRIHIQMNFPKMRQGGLDAGLFSIDVTRAYQNHLAYAMDGLGYFLTDLEQRAQGVAIVRSTGDLLRAKAEGKLAVVLAIEHADCTERSLNILRSLYAVGVRSIGLTHNISSAAGDGCLEARPGVGLSSYGARLIREMNRLGMLVDLAHASDSLFFSTLDVSDRPVAFTHGNARAICEHPRNLTDEQLKALAANGGIIGITFVPSFVDPQTATIDRLLDHVDRIVAVAGVDTVAIGSDFDGGGTILADATEVPLITKGLIERGYTEGEIRKILGLNVLRVLQATIG